MELTAMNIDASDFNSFVEGIKDTKYYQDLSMNKSERMLELYLMNEFKDYRENNEQYSSEHSFCMKVEDELDVSDRFYPLPFSPYAEWVYREAQSLYREGYSYSDAADNIYNNYDPTP